MEDPVVRLKRLKMAAHRAALQSHIPRTQLLSAAIHISAGPENRFSFHFHCSVYTMRLNPPFLAAICTLALVECHKFACLTL